MSFLKDKNARNIIILICLITTIGRFALDSYLPSLTAIGSALKISDDTIQLTLTFYLFGFGFSQLVYGPASDQFGRRKVLLVGCGIFILGSLLCILADHIITLLLARFVAGFGGGATAVLNRAIASDNFKGADFAKAWSYTTTTLIITLIIAPVIGGFIQQILGWQANFALVSIYAILITLLLFFYLPETNQSPNPSALAINNFVKNYKTILTYKPFIAGVACYTFTFSSLVVYFQLSPLLFIKQLGLTPVQYGWTSLAIAGCYLAGGFLVNKYVRATGTQLLLAIGILLLIVGGLSLFISSSFDQCCLWAILIPSLIAILGARIVIPNALAESLAGFSNIAGSASALTGGIQILGSALISTLVSTLSGRNPQYTLAACFTLLGIASYLSFKILPSPVANVKIAKGTI